MPTTLEVLAAIRPERPSAVWRTVHVGEHSYDIAVCGFTPAYQAVVASLRRGGQPDAAIPRALAAQCVHGIRGLSWPSSAPRAGEAVTIAEYRALLADPAFMALFVQAYRAVAEVSEGANGTAV